LKIKKLIRLMDLKTLVAGTLPVIYGSVFSAYAFGKFNYIFFILLFIAMILVQSSANMINDYFDYKFGTDYQGRDNRNLLTSGEVTKKQVWTVVSIYYFIALVIGIIIGYYTSYYILLIALAGAFISFIYSFGPLPISRTPIGEFVSGSTMGIGITTTVIYIQSGIINYVTLLTAIPTAIFIGTILLSNNICDREEDIRSGRKTLTILIGVRRSEILWIINVIMLGVLAFVYYFLKIFPIPVVVIVLLLFPYKTLKYFLSLEKDRSTKEEIMGIIGMIGIKYHIALIIGLLIQMILIR